MMFESKNGIESLRLEVSQLKQDFYGVLPDDGIVFNLNHLLERQKRLEKKLDMLMDYLGVEEKHEPEKWYIDRRDNED